MSQLMHLVLNGIGLDSCVIPLRHGNLNLIQTTDFFYPMVDNPYTMGRIACCNVLSDLYAMGVTQCDNMLMLLGVSTKFTDEERDIATKLLIKGFKDCADEAGTSIQGGQSVRNPWVIIGGVATSVCANHEFIVPNRARDGDVLVLTKALGTQVAGNLYQWFCKNTDRWQKLKEILTEEDVLTAYETAAAQMARLNRVGAQLMHKYSANACTDVTGFGILGHAQNLVNTQEDCVRFVIHNLPIIANMATVSKELGGAFGLLKGVSAETSGGLLIAMSRDNANSFCEEIMKLEKQSAWIIGVVEKSDERLAVISDEARVIEVQDPNLAITFN